MNKPSRFGGWIKKRLEDTENLFTCWLPRHTGIFSMFVLRRLFSGICLNPDLKATLKELPADAVIVYASKTKSYFEFLCYYTRYMQARLPYPQLGFDCSIRIWQPVGRLIRIAIVQLQFFLRHFRSGTLTEPDSFGTKSAREPLPFYR